MWRSQPKPKPKSKSKSKSDREINNINGGDSTSIVTKPSTNLNFIHSSLKDVVNLLSDDVTNTVNKTLAQPSPSPSATRRLSIFHRVHLANKFARAFSTNLSPNFTKSQPNSTDISPVSILTKYTKSAQSDRQISIPEAEKHSADNRLTKNSKSTQSDGQISIPEAEKHSPDNELTEASKSTQSDGQILIPGAEEYLADNKFTKTSKPTQSDGQISIPVAENHSPDNKLTKTSKSTQSDRQISIPKPVATKYFKSNTQILFSESEEQVITKPSKSTQPNRQITTPGAENRIILYTTTLRVVRSTFEACKTVKSILRTFRVSIDERDVSMDSNFLHELKHIMNQLGEEYEVEKTKLALPKVFIGGVYIGGAEEVKELHEIGELKKVVDRLPVVTGGVCEVCGDYRFVVCDECDGSRKCYSEKSGVFRSCTLCNENGLVRCPVCLGC